MGAGAGGQVLEFLPTVARLQVVQARIVVLEALEPVVWRLSVLLGTMITFRRCLSSILAISVRFH
jgi:hypothetical protein